jgi:hypothetical protein
VTDEQKEEQRKRINEKLDRIAGATGGRTKPGDDRKEEKKLRRLR